MGTEIDSLNFVTEWQEGGSQTLQRIESLNSVTEQQDGLSKARWAVTDRVIPSRVGFMLNVLRGRFGLFLLIIIKLVVEY